MTIGNPTLSPAWRAFLAAARRGVLATQGPGGRPRLVPVCFVLGPDEGAAPGTGPLRIYSPLDDKPKRARDPRELARVRDIAARPGVSLLVDRWDESWGRLAWLRVEGSAELIEPDASPAEHRVAIHALRVKYPQYIGHDLEDRPIIRIVVERSTSWGTIE